MELEYRKARTRFRALGGTRTSLPDGEMVAPGEPASLTSESFTGADALASGMVPDDGSGFPAATITTTHEERA